MIVFAPDGKRNSSAAPQPVAAPRAHDLSFSVPSPERRMRRHRLAGTLTLKQLSSANGVISAMQHLAMFAAGCAACLLGGACAAAHSYTFAPLAVPGAEGTSVTGVSGSGIAVGYYYSRAGEGAFIDNNGSFTTFQVPGAWQTWPGAVNDSGSVAGTYYYSGGYSGFVYNNSALQTISLFGGAINTSGTVIGTYGRQGVADSGGTFSPVDVPGSNSTTPTGINASGEVAGYYLTAKYDEYGFTYDAGTYNTLYVPGSRWTAALAINDAGDVAGYYETPNFQFGGFIDRAGLLVTFTLPGEPYEGRMTLTQSGEVVGSYTDSSGNWHGYVYDAGSLATLDDPGATSTLLMGVDNAGAIFGEDGLQSFVAVPAASPVSEPAGLGLIGMAAAGLGWLRRRGPGRRPPE